jgi:hypothetical protein
MTAGSVFLGGLLVRGLEKLVQLHLDGPARPKNLFVGAAWEFDAELGELAAKVRWSQIETGHGQSTFRRREYDLSVRGEYC